MGFLKSFFGIPTTQKASSGIQKPHRKPVTRRIRQQRTAAQKAKVVKIQSQDTVNNLVYDPANVPQRLKDKLNEGGEGSVWTLENPNLAKIVVKVFHPQKLQEHGFSGYMEEKIKAIRSVSKKDDSIAWPIIPVYNKDREFTGFAMQRVVGKKLCIVMNPRASKSICPNWDRGNYLKLALDLVRKIRNLHVLGFILGDINPNNFMIDVSNNSVGFIDTDSYQLSLNGRIFRCAVGTPEYTPPELQGYDFKTIDRSSHADFFGAAVIIFQILMRSRHPFDIVNGKSPAENIKKGNFPYGTNQGKLIPKGNWIKLWSHLPKRIKDMFHRAFIGGVNNPTARPSMEEWAEALEIYWKDSQKGWHDLSLMPTDFKSQDYHGKRPI